MSKSHVKLIQKDKILFLVKSIFNYMACKCIKAMEKKRREGSGGTFSSFGNNQKATPTPIPNHIINFGTVLQPCSFNLFLNPYQLLLIIITVTVFPIVLDHPTFIFSKFTDNSFTSYKN
ncbi:hypothetical protein S83_025463 [Arachis hypogaea]